VCNKGYYCPPGSTSATQNPCPAGTYGTTTEGWGGLITTANDISGSPPCNTWKTFDSINFRWISPVHRGYFSELYADIGTCPKE
jgi:hypothetical protein